MKTWLIALIAGGALATAACDKPTESEAPKAETEVEQQEETNEAPEDEAQPAEEETVEAEEKDPLAPPENVAAPPEDAETTESGMSYIVVKEGEGEKPSATSTVTIHYTGWTTDGKMFDSSHKRGKPATFPLPNLIKGWQEGVPMMRKGATYRFWIPAKLAYGENPRPGAPKGQLTFDIELIDFK